MDPSLPKAPFPAPPPFYKAFTTKNLERLSSAPNQSSASTSVPPPLALELSYLRPPPPPPASAATYETFSQPNLQHITPVLPPAELLLFDPAALQNPAALLLRLTKSLLLNFLALTTILSESPEEYADKVEDIRRIVVNVHAVINLWRPHQAREEVRGMLEEMIREGEKEILEADRAKGEIEGFLDDVAKWKEDEDGDTGPSGSGVNGHKAGSERGRVEGNDKAEDGEGEMIKERAEEVNRLWKLIGEIGEE